MVSGVRGADVNGPLQCGGGVQGRGSTPQLCDRCRSSGSLCVWAVKYTCVSQLSSPPYVDQAGVNKPELGISLPQVSQVLVSQPAGVALVDQSSLRAGRVPNCTGLFHNGSSSLPPPA